MNRITPIVRNLILVNVTIYILQRFIHSIDVTGLMSLWGINSGNFKPYQFLTYMFAHDPNGIGHLFFNMFALYSFGSSLESYWGDKKFLSFYLICGIGAGIFFNVIEYIFFDSSGLMLGASGAIYGVLMAYGLLFPENEIILLLFPVPIKAKYIVFIAGFLTYLMDHTGQVAHNAHLGGAIVGFIMVTYWRRR